MSKMGGGGGRGQDGHVGRGLCEEGGSNLMHMKIAT